MIRVLVVFKVSSLKSKSVIRDHDREYGAKFDKQNFRVT
jgi:hypothetical protein